MARTPYKEMYLAIDPRHFVNPTIRHKNTLRMIVVMVGIQFVVTCLMHFEYKSIPPTHYFIVDPDQKVTPTYTFDAPIFNLQQLFIWVMESITDVFSLDFLNLDNQLENAKKYFTPAGYESFISAITEAGIISDIQQGKIILSSVPTGFPVVSLEHPDANGGYEWTIQVPMRLSYQSANEVRYKDIVQEILVKRISTLDSPRGVGIERLRVLGSKT